MLRMLLGNLDQFLNNWRQLRNGAVLSESYFKKVAKCKWQAHASSSFLNVCDKRQFMHELLVIMIQSDQVIIESPFCVRTEKRMTQ